MSPRAAWRLESLGFTQVYDYVGGKAEWLANGLRTEGTLATTPRAGAFAHPDVVTCRLDDSVKAARKRMEEAQQETCIVINEQRVVLGRLRKQDAQSQNDQPVEGVMESGPSTFRPNVSLEEMTEYMRKRNMPDALITTADGILVGILFLQDSERVLNESRDASVQAH